MSIPEILKRNQPLYHEVMRGLHLAENLIAVDMSKDNQELMALDVTDTVLFSRWMENTLTGKIGWGGYLEHREMYRRSAHFDGQGEPRSLHLGIDLWAPAGTPVYCPLDGLVDSCVDNAGFGDYGPTIILRHELEGAVFYSLYGHLSRSSLAGLGEGQQIVGGSQLATLGNINENGHWPPHLHFQLMTDLMGKKGDFPGVAALSERNKYQVICPDPDMILQCGRQGKQAGHH